MRARLHSMRWRIAGAFSILITLALSILALALFIVAQSTYLRTLEAGTAGQARLVAALVGEQPSPLRPSEKLTAQVQAWARQLDARVTLIAPDGTVLADSLVPPSRDNLRTRPEVAAALATGQGESARASSATGDDRFFVAVPIGASAAPRGVARVGVALTTIAQAQRQFGGAIALAALCALGGAVLLAVLVARRITQPLLDLRALAGRLASGQLGAQVPLPREPELAALARDFNQMARRLQAAEQARRSGLANVTHDLRTPLASLAAMIETLEDGALDDRPAAQDFLRRMALETASMGRLVDEFIALSQIASGALELHPVPTDVSGLLASIAQRMAAQAEQRGVALVVAPAPDLPLVSFDPQRIAQVLLNLVQNALAATPAGGQITLSVARGDAAVRIAVADTGAGIAPTDLPHIFERFYKADRARSGGGTGLGLAIVRHLVERHGGTVAAQSSVGLGTTITITLPLR